jgi:hypothetical protein
MAVKLAMPTGIKRMDELRSHGKFCIAATSRHVIVGALARGIVPR